MVFVGLFLYCLGWGIGAFTGYCYGYGRALKDLERLKPRIKVSDLYPPKS